MINLKKKSQTLILLVLVIILSINTNFFKNLYGIISEKFDKRITKKYGYCNGESVGYLLHIKKKYQINDNPKIINYNHEPSLDWTIINTKKINHKSNKLILLNYPGPVIIKSLDRIDNNLFVLTDTHFFVDKFNKIKNIEILNNSNDGKKFNWTINIYNYDKFRNMNNIKTLMIKGSFDTRLKINLDMNLNDLDLNQTKLYFEIYKNEVAELENLKINIELKNKYILENFQIIDNTKDCYYLERV
jgi:hypothetical protein|tara:strand:- start:11 stop:745 length:735 start_codon:yes stop_codon:yes gene_type:complete